MKKLILMLCLVCAPMPALFTACSTSPTTQAVEVQTLKSIGQAAEAAVALAADLYGARKITADQARAVMSFYNGTFQPAFRIAKDSARNNLAAIAPADLIALSTQLTILVSKIQSP